MLIEKAQGQYNDLSVLETRSCAPLYLKQPSKDRDISSPMFTVGSFQILEAALGRACRHGTAVQCEFCKISKEDTLLHVRPVP